MNNTPLVSIIIPVYNGSNYLREAIGSALGQTYPNVEVLVINDGSRDEGKTHEVAISYGDKIRYVNKENGGVSTALNAGIGEMKGTHFIWLSHDDLLSPDRVETDMRMLADPDIKIVFCRRQVISETGLHLHHVSYPLNRVTSIMDMWEMLGGLSMCSITISKDCFQTVGLFDEDNRMTQDLQMSLRLAKAYNFHFNPAPLFSSREHQQRGTHADKGLHQQQLIKIAEYLRENADFSDFFPGRVGDYPSNYYCWIKIGLVYEFLGDQESAEKYFKISVLNRPTRGGRISSAISLMLNWSMVENSKQIGRFFYLSRKFFMIALNNR